MCFGFYSKALITCHLNTVLDDLYHVLVVSVHIYHTIFWKKSPNLIIIITVLIYYQFAVIFLRMSMQL